MRPETGNNILECKKILIPFSEYQNLKGSLSDFEQAILILQRENADRNKEIEELRRKNIVLQNSNAIYQARSAESEINQLKGEIQHWKTSSLVLQDQKINQRVEIEDLKEALKLANEQVARSDSRIVELNKRCLDAEDYKTKRIQELERELLIRNNKIDSLQKDMQSLKAENDHIAFSRQNALSEVSSFETRLNSKNDVIFQLQEEIKKLEHLLNVDKGTWIKKENDNLKKEIETLRSKLAGCEKTT
jgi:chromosome segregation ATPase